MADEAVMIRARASTRDALREIAEERNTSLIEALDQIVQSAREERLLAAVAITLSGEHLHAVVAETEALDRGIGSEGLSGDEDFSDW